MSDIIPIATEWLINYGGYILFLVLTLGMIGPPIPNESLLIIAGWLIARGELSMIAIIFWCMAGTTLGITISYWLGLKTSNWFIRKIGKYVGLTQERVDRVKHMFSRWGKWTLLLGYFLPVLRYVFPFVAGSSKFKFHKFSLYAYTGAALWTFCFLGIGYFIKTK